MRYNHELNGNLRTACNRPMSADDNQRLYPLVAAGDTDARERMIVGNMPLVMALAESYLAAKPQYGHLQDDLIANGFIGVVKAVNELANGKSKSKVNPTSYISLSIRRHFRFATADDSLIHTPRGRQPIRTSTTKDSSKIMLSVRGKTVSGVDLRDAIDSCCQSSLDRELVSLREAGHTTRQMARLTGVSEPTVRRMFRAIRDRFDAKMKELQQ
jgi:RNA polymerase sigma factor (sigma-70 family)